MTYSIHPHRRLTCFTQNWIRWPSHIQCPDMRHKPMTLSGRWHWPSREPKSDGALKCKWRVGDKWTSTDSITHATIWQKSFCTSSVSWASWESRWVRDTIHLLNTAKLTCCSSPGTSLLRRSRPCGDFSVSTDSGQWVEDNRSVLSSTTAFGFRVPRVSKYQVEEWSGADCKASVQIPFLDHLSCGILYNDQPRLCRYHLGLNLPRLQSALSQVKVSKRRRKASICHSLAFNSFFLYPSYPFLWND